MTLCSGCRDQWQDVPWCVWVSTRSCDVSQAFSNFDLYYMIRLGVHLSPSSTVWIKPLKFDYSDFSRSSLSLLHFSIEVFRNEIQIPVCDV